MSTKNKTLEELAKEIAEKIADEFMKSILSRLTSEIIGLREDTNELKASMNKVWEAIDRLAEAQKRTEERLNELAEAQKETEKRLNELAEAQKRTEEEFAEFSSEFRTFTNWARDVFGVWSHTVGFGAEAIVREVFRTISQMGGYKFDEIWIPPLKDIKSIKAKKNGYQFDLMGFHGDEIWIIEVKTRFLLSKTQVDNMLKGLENWRKINLNKRFIYMLLTLAGYKEGLRNYIKRKIESLGGKAIILDDEKTKKFLKRFGYEI